MSETTSSFRALRATDHSLHFVGQISLDNAIVEFRDERPLGGTVERYVFANGFGGTKESMAVPRCVAAHEGYDARAMGSNHNHLGHAIDRYAKEIIAVAGFEDEESGGPAIERVHLVGMSMGGAAVLRAAANCPKVATVTAEVPACISDSNKIIDLFQGTRDRVSELSRLVCNEPGFALRTAIHSTLGVIRRPFGVLAEAIDIATEGVAEDIRTIKAMEQAPHVRILVSDKDGFVRKRGVIQAANRLGVEVIIVSGSGHINGVLTDPQYTRNVVELNRTA